VIDRTPRTWTPAQSDTLARLARQVVNQLELRATAAKFNASLAELEFVKEVVDQTRDPIYWLSPTQGFRFVYVNEAACEHYGRSASELLQMTIPDWDPDFTLARCEATWKEIKRKRTVLFETRHRLSGGEIVPVEVTANYVLAGGQEFIAGTIRNIA